MVDFVVLIPGPELNREFFWDGFDGEIVYKNPAALAREAVFGVCSPPINAIAVATEVSRLGYSVELLDVGLEFGVPFTASGIEERYHLIRDTLENMAPNHGILITSLTAREHTAILRLAKIAKS